MLTHKTKQLFKKIFGDIFSGNQFTNNIFANILGIQIFRYIFGKIVYNIKYNCKNYRNKSLEKKGFIIIENFLIEEEYKKVLADFEEAIIDKEFSLFYDKYGKGVDAYHVYIDEKIKKKYNNVFNFTKNKKIIDLFENNEVKSNVEIVVKAERLKAKENPEKDLSKMLHCDTYYNTFKAWYYLSDVSLDDGPLNYVQGSHKFSIKRIFYEYFFSLKFTLYKILKKQWPGYGVFSKSYSDYEKIIKKLSVKKNTLIFANTHALHRRGDSKINTQRDTIHFYTRENPFHLF